MNCWEFIKCGREANGAKVGELGVCPAYPDHGTKCAHTPGTLCHGKVSGSFATKLADCMECDFFKCPDYDARKGERRLNCWEFNKCGRELNGNRVKEMGVCPAYPHHGTRCAHTSGTLCRGKIQGSFGKKIATCLVCDFYNSPNYNKTSRFFKR